MTVELKDGMTVLHAFKVGTKHGFAGETPPKIYVQKTYFSSTDTESHMLLGRGERMLYVDVWINDAAFTTRPLFDAYLLELDRLIGDKDKAGTLEITIDGVDQSYDNVYLAAFRRGTPGGQRFGVPLPNGLNAPYAPAGNFWLPGLLEFVQVSV